MIRVSNQRLWTNWKIWPKMQESKLLLLVTKTGRHQFHRKEKERVVTKMEKGVVNPMVSLMEIATENLRVKEMVNLMVSLMESQMESPKVEEMAGQIVETDYCKEMVIDRKVLVIL